MNAAPQMMLVGRILLATIFLVAGTRKLMAIAGTTAYMTKLGFPMPEVMVWVVRDERPFAGAGWPIRFEWLHGLGLFVAVSLTAGAIGRPVRRRRGRPRRPPSALVQAAPLPPPQPWAALEPPPVEQATWSATQWT